MPAGGTRRGAAASKRGHHPPAQAQASLEPPPPAASLDAPSTLSTAPLPPRFTLHVATVGRPSDSQLAATYARGCEDISDVRGVSASIAAALPIVPRKSNVRRVNCYEPLSSHGRPLPPPPRPPRKAVHNNSGSSGNSSLQAEWRNAAFSYPSICTLPRYRSALTPRERPPLAADLPPPPHPNGELHQQHVPVGDELLPWSTEDFGETDLDAGLHDDVLLDFGHWVRAAPALVRPLPAGRQPSEAPPAFKPPPPPPPSPRTVKAKDFAIGSSALGLVVAPTQGSPPTPPTPPPPPPQHPPAADPDWAERRTWWREQIDNDSNYGQHWRHMSRRATNTGTTSTTSTSKSSKSTSKPTPKSTPPPPTATDAHSFALPRPPPGQTSPFHPSFPHYACTARTRVYWLIPVHGPVIVPGVDDAITGAGVEWLSQGRFGAAMDDGTLPLPPRETERPTPLHWTPSLLAALETYLTKLHADFVGRVVLAVSGPKPDPYLALPPPEPLAAHQHVPEADGQDTAAPVRPEAGDHLRVYCDAAHALRVRNAVHMWPLWLDPFGVPLAVPLEKKWVGRVRKWQPFGRARLALVGPRGEVLTVA